MGCESNPAELDTVLGSTTFSFLSNYSARAENFPCLQRLTVQMCFKFVHSGLRSIYMIFEMAGMDEDGVQLNSYVSYMVNWLKSNGSRYGCKHRAEEML